MSYPKSRRHLIAVVAAFAMLSLGTTTGAQDATPSALADLLNGATVALYEGTCDQPASEPSSVLGELEQRRVVDLSEVAAATEADDEAPGTILLEGEDINDNGVLDEGEDRNGNGRLDAGLLERGDVIPETTLNLANVDEVWMLESPIEIDLDAQAGAEWALAIQRETDGDPRFIACGVHQIPAPQDENTSFYFDLEPVTTEEFPGFRGYARLVGSGDEERVLRVVMFETLPEEARGQDATPTP